MHVNRLFAVVLGLGLLAAPGLQAQDTFDDDFDDEPAEEQYDEYDEYDEGDTGGEDKPTPQSRKLQLFRAHNTFAGPTGGLHITDAGSGLPGQFRLQLAFDTFGSSDYLAPGDENNYIGGSLALSWTVIEHLEAFFAIANHANSNNTGDPPLLQVLGDTALGVKGYADLAPWFTAGGDVRLVFLNTVGDIGLVMEGTSFGFRGNATADFRGLDSPVPLIARLSLDYFFDNSASLIEDVEKRRLDALEDPADKPGDEDRHLLTRVERFALGINRLDRFTIGLGLEAPLEVATDFFIHPMLEWELGLPVNRQDYNCLLVGTHADIDEEDGCLDIEGIRAMPSTLTLGVRVFPPLRGLAVLLGADIGVSGTSTFVRELAPNRPWAFILGFSYAFDTTAKGKGEVREVEVVREVDRTPPPGPRVVGLVVEEGLGGAVANAVVRYPGTELTAQQADSEGRFVSYEMEPGEAQFEISHPDYETRLCVVQIPEPVKPSPKAPAPAAPGQPGTPAQPATPATPAPAQGPAPGQVGFQASTQGSLEVGGSAQFGSQLAPAPAPAQPAPVQPAPVQPAPVQPAPVQPAPADAAPAAAPQATETAAAEEPLMVPLRCELTAKPKFGDIRGSVIDAEDGKPVGGINVTLSGPSNHTLTTDAAGIFRAAEVPPGSYTARVDGDAYLIKHQTFELEARTKAEPQIAVLKKPKRASVTMTKSEVKIRKKILFKTNSAEIDEKSSGLLSEIADILMRNPQVTKVEIQGHTDNRGEVQFNAELSQNRAESVRNWLVTAGVEAQRLEAKGFGDKRPLVPNLTSANRARNRRVQFIIREQTGK